MVCSLPGSSVHGISQERILELGCHFLLQEIFLVWELNLCLLHWQANSLPLNHQRSSPVSPMLLVVIVMVVPGFYLLAYVAYFGVQSSSLLLTR